MPTRITEPATLVTDYALAGVTCVLGVLLLRASRAGGQRSVGLCSLSFLATSLAALTGGTYHGFTLLLGPMTLSLLWKASVFSVAVGSALLLASVSYATLATQTRRILLCVLTLKFAAYAAWMVFHDDFRFVIYAYVPDMLGVLALAAWTAASRDNAAGWMIAGVLLSLGAAGVQQSGWSVAKSFNHNDLYHVIQAGAFLLLYQGGFRLRDR